MTAPLHTRTLMYPSHISQMTKDGLPSLPVAVLTPVAPREHRVNIHTSLHLIRCIHIAALLEMYKDKQYQKCLIITYSN